MIADAALGFVQLCVFGLLAAAAFFWMWAAACLAGDLAVDRRQSWAAAGLLIVSAIGLGLTALAFWPRSPEPPPAVSWRAGTPA